MKIIVENWKWNRLSQIYESDMKSSFKTVNGDCCQLKNFSELMKDSFHNAKFYSVLGMKALLKEWKVLYI